MKKIFYFTIGLNLIAFVVIILLNLNFYLFLINIFLFVVIFLIGYFLLVEIIESYPLNDYCEYEWNPLNSTIVSQDQKRFVIDFYVNESLWETKHEKENIRFDMKGFVFPKTYICAYFIRNLNYIIMNKKHMFFKKLPLSNCLLPFDKYENLFLRFHIKNKVILKKVVKNYKTISPFLSLRYIINSIVLTELNYGGYRGKCPKIKVGEFLYLNRKKKYK